MQITAIPTNAVNFIAPTYLEVYSIQLYLITIGIYLEVVQLFLYSLNQ